MPIIIKVGIIVVAVMLILLIVLCVALVQFAAQPKRDFEASRRWEKEHGFYRNYDELKKTEYTIKSYDGYELHVVYIPADEPTDRYVIINHGYTSSRFGGFKYVHMYRRLGFSCIIYDNRGHGLNKKVSVTFGVKESKDYAELVKDTYERYGKDIRLGTHGESMGSALQITALKYGVKPEFIVNDCGFADLVTVEKGGLKSLFHLPGWPVYPASALCRVMYGYSFTEARPIDSLPGNKIPICFIHGANDDFIVPEHSERMQKVTEGYSELHLIDGAGHAESMYHAEAEYNEIVEKFLKTINYL